MTTATSPLRSAASPEPPRCSAGDLPHVGRRRHPRSRCRPAAGSAPVRSGPSLQGRADLSRAGRGRTRSPRAGSASSSRSPSAPRRCAAAGRRTATGPGPRSSGRSRAASPTLPSSARRAAGSSRRSPRSSAGAVKRIVAGRHQRVVTGQQVGAGPGLVDREVVDHRVHREGQRVLQLAAWSRA